MEEGDQREGAQCRLQGARRRWESGSRSRRKDTVGRTPDTGHWALGSERGG